MRALCTPIEDDGDLYCASAKCRRHMARLVRGVLTAGGIQIYGRVKYFCASCGKRYSYVEKLTEDTSPPPEGALEIQRGLGKDYSDSWRYDVERRKRKAAEDKKR